MPHVIAETQETLESGRREALEYLAGVAACLEQKGLPRPEAAIEVGVSPALGILRQAERAAADLIVITTHARSGLPRLVLGSVADKLVRAAEVPVLVTRAPE
jgi:nucleotide-binding universal stress UspA family protein